MADSIDEAIAMTRRAEKRPGSYEFLPEIIGTLEQMRDSLSKDRVGSEQRCGMAGALARLVTENGSWGVTSVLGRRLLSLAGDFATAPPGQ